MSLTAGESRGVTVTADNPRLNASGNIVFHGLESQVSSLVSFFRGRNLLCLRRSRQTQKPDNSKPIIFFLISTIVARSLLISSSSLLSYNQNLI
ncbi:unnamed protein product [Arabis nemorensis]|uniref:Uncharacterized protein n=1 Tax=Arabis nemorensis TaxID=586526 RepID=A0A565BBV2_9BRAS|nr:unnamed protein product [Arabis nemorensis]